MGPLCDGRIVGAVRFWNPKKIKINKNKLLLIFTKQLNRDRV